MRITGGAARSIQLKTLDLPQLRPATDQMRQAIFNSLGALVVGARFLDLFAGSGAYGLEAFSRGASGGVFVESHPRLAKLIEANLQAVAKSAQRHPADCKIRATDVLKLKVSQISEAEQSFDLVFCDPPYAMIEEKLEALSQLSAQALRPGGLWLLEHPSGLSLSLPLSVLSGFQLLKTLGGKTPQSPNIAIYQKKNLM